MFVFFNPISFSPCPDLYYTCIVLKLLFIKGGKKNNLLSQVISVQYILHPECKVVIFACLAPALCVVQEPAACIVCVEQSFNIFFLLRTKKIKKIESHFLKTVLCLAFLSEAFLPTEASFRDFVPSRPGLTKLSLRSVSLSHFSTTLTKPLWTVERHCCASHTMCLTPSWMPLSQHPW